MDIKSLSNDELIALAANIREQILQAVSKNGGHLSSNLGVVELIIAMHAVFDSSKDPFIFDVSHQCYAHKILTGRSLETLRQFKGIGGYTNPHESECDYFVAGHSSTSISLAVGAAKAVELKGDERIPVVLIGDGAMSAGEAYEALNELGDRKYPCVIILNDNEMSIAKPVGALSKYISHAMAGPWYQSFKARINELLKYAPDSAAYMAKRLEEGIRLITPGMLFEELGLEYIGPINGHNISEIISTLRTAKAMKKPVIVHAQTIKGKGYAPAEGKFEKWHGVSPFELEDKEKKAEVNYEITRNSRIPSANESPKTATQIFSSALLSLAKNNEKITGITAAMPSGTGLDALLKEYPQRFWDVAIAEQHAVTQAGALAKEGFRPYVAIYSTFLQRAYDQIIHDVCILDLPVVFCIDRAGIVGEDGATHQGAFDISFLNALPSIELAAPTCEADFKALLSWSQSAAHPLALRYPRGRFICDELKDELEIDACEFKPYKASFVKTAQSDLLFIGYGNAVGKACAVANKLGGANVVNLGFAKPLDEEFLRKLSASFKTWYIFSESAKKGGVGEILSSFVNENDLGVKIISFEYEDAFITHGKKELVEASLGLDAASIAEKIKAYKSAKK